VSRRRRRSSGWRSTTSCPWASILRSNVLTGVAVGFRAPSPR
jgi:hypothetical protein